MSTSALSLASTVRLSSGCMMPLLGLGVYQNYHTAGSVVDALAAGYSGIHHLEEIENAALELPSVNQIELHPFCQQKPIVAWCRARNIVVQAYCPLIRGRMDHPTIVALAKKYNRDPAHILLRWSLQHGFSPLPKSEHKERIISNANLYDFELDGDDMAALDALDKGDEGAIQWNPIHVP
ncbi:hypothetical protein EWM64_g7030 [Hericium alpestre]|uniref:NADP-dependent oxidoreductase domain-containing protein n=1 Tax=Hericium alpestre TaxID=135208 RepID=A0A4Y9ZQD1_9AGAM|nr:hypothetical protein EWM64_g7030 [Hericium alpestre]